MQEIAGEYPAFETEIRRGAPTAAFGVSDSLKYLLSSLLPFPVLYITTDAISAKKAAENAATLSGKQTAVLTAKDEVLFYRKALSKDSFFKRLNGIDALKSGCPFVAAEIDAVLQIFPKDLPCLRFEEGEETDFLSVAATLTKMGYSRGYEVETKGAFALRGDILDIFPVNLEHPVRVDFFGDTVEKIKPYDLTTGERLGRMQSLKILAATDVFVSQEEEKGLGVLLEKESKKFKTTEAYERARSIIDELLSDTAGEKGFLLPILENSTDIFGVLPKDTVIVFDESKSVWDKLNALYKDHEERFHRLQEGGEAFDFSLYQIQEKEKFLSGLENFRRVALQTFTGNPFFFQPLQIFNFSVTPTTKYLNGVPTLLTDIKNWLKGDYRVVLFCGDVNRATKMSEMLTDEYLPVSRFTNALETQKGVVVSSEKLEKGFVLHECKLALIGTSDLYTKPPENKRIRRKRGDMFSAPEIGDYAVHEKHGIGKVIGTKKIETTDGTKEYVALSYKDGDVLYVPVENMDVLSKYVGDSNPPLPILTCFPPFS